MSKKENNRNKKGLIPTKKQWNSWSLPSKYGALGVLLAILGIIISIALAMPITSGEQKVDHKPVERLKVKASFFFDKGKKNLPYLLFTTTNMGNDDVVLSKQTLLFNSGKGQYFFSGFASDTPNNYPIRLKPQDQYKRYHSIVDIVDRLEIDPPFHIDTTTIFFLEAKTSVGNIYYSDSTSFKKLIEVRDGYYHQ